MQLSKLMSATVLCKPSQLVVFLPNLKAALKRSRAFSSFRERRTDIVYLERQQKESSTVWPDSTLGPFAPKDKRFLLPDNVGLYNQLYSKTEAPSLPKTDSNNLSIVLQDRHMTTLVQFLNSSTELVNEDNPFDELFPGMEAINLLECVAQECPGLVKKDFQELFPTLNLTDIQLTVITFSQRTKNDMTSWSPEVDAEREELVEKFVETAKTLCELFKQAGYWADLIDPCSGRPFLGPFTNATMFETDERYRHFGFQIKDLGCCKVISHHLWGTHAFVGCLFTSAPLNSNEVAAVLETFRPRTRQ